MDSRVIQRSGQIEPRPAIALAGLFGIPAEDVAPDVPPMWHWIYLLDAWQRKDLGIDGHSRSGMPTPPSGDHTRMFAGGRTHHIHPLEFGTAAQKTSRVIRSVDKQGRSGPLTFVTVQHKYSQAGRIAIVEEQDIVYKRLTHEPGHLTAPRTMTPATVTSEPAANRVPPLRFEIDNVALFLFSALTYNPHRIHYDSAYAASEGHPDLVVHGPLQIMLMAEALRREAIPALGAEFAYRLLAPATGPQTLTVEVETTSSVPTLGENETRVRVQDGTGHITAEGLLRAPTIDEQLDDKSVNPAAAVS